MILEIDFDSDEAFYMQLRNQIVLGIATKEIKEGDSLPSVRQLAEIVGINMHTVNKAYAILKEEGFLSMDRHLGAVVELDTDKCSELEKTKNILQVVLAKAHCKHITKEEIHHMIDEIYSDYE